MTTTLAALTVEAPDVAGPLAVFPLFGPAPELEYLSFAEAAAAGATVVELPEGADVNTLLVRNPLDQHVLLYEGEELLGAQQNRTVDGAVLVPARSSLKVAVSCVEHGRWDGSRRDEAFAPSARAAYPALRAAKSRRMRERLAAGLDARADQQEVWDAVAGKMDEVAAPSATGAMGDAFDHRDESLAKLRDAIHRREGQCGALVAISGRYAVLDLVSRSDVFAALHGPLLEGYALDALDKPDGAVPTLDTAQAIVAMIMSAQLQTGRAASGLGEPVHLSTGAIGGTGLRVGEELIQLSAFVGEAPRAHGIRRPSRRA